MGPKCCPKDQLLGIRMRDPGKKKFGSGSGMNIPDNFSESLETVFRVKILKFFDADPDPGIRNLIDPGSGMEKFGSGIQGQKDFESLIRIRIKEFKYFPRHCKKRPRKFFFCQGPVSCSVAMSPIS
jgi:hypothetical protein